MDSLDEICSFGIIAHGLSLYTCEMVNNPEFGGGRVTHKQDNGVSLYHTIRRQHGCFLSLWYDNKQREALGITEYDR
jgi:hypothetical protein